MRPFQNLPRRWLITDPRLGSVIAAVRRLPIGSGVLLRHHHLPAAERRRLWRQLRRIAAARGLLLIDEARGTAARVHNPREIRRARLHGKRPLFLSPLFATRSHPAMPPLPRMRAAALARLAGARVIALGGMDESRFRAVRRIGFYGWAGIDAWTARIRT